MYIVEVEYVIEFICMDGGRIEWALSPVNISSFALKFYSIDCYMYWRNERRPAEVNKRFRKTVI